MNELDIPIFVPISGFEKSYELHIMADNNEVRVWSTTGKGKYLKPWEHTKGYRKVSLSKDKTQSSHFVHRLIALHLIPNPDPDNKKVVDHKNGNRSDNRLSNLRWATASENGHNRKDAKGYSWDKYKNKWLVNISINGKNKNLGRFKTEEEARIAYKNASATNYPGVCS